MTYVTELTTFQRQIRKARWTPLLLSLALLVNDDIHQKIILYFEVIRTQYVSMTNSVTKKANNVS